MANPADHRDESEGAALAHLLDPVALEARLADARARRAAALAAKAAAPEPADPRTPLRGPLLAGLAAVRARWRFRPKALVLAGLAAALGGTVLPPLLHSAPPPEVVLTAAAPARPAGVPSAPVVGTAAGWAAAVASPPQLAALARGPMALPPPRPPTLAAAPAQARTASRAETSRQRTGGASLAQAAPVLAQAATAAVLTMINRSAEMGDRAAPKAVRQAEGLVRQIGAAGRSALKQGDRGGESLAKSVRRAAAALQGKGKSRAHGKGKRSGKRGRR